MYEILNLKFQIFKKKEKERKRRKMDEMSDKEKFKTHGRINCQ